MMSIFGSPFCYTPVAPQPSLSPLFRLLDEFDSYARELGLEQHAQAQRRNLQQQQGQQRRAATVPTFTPKFDARETEQGYELHGELPGISRENLNIEFTNPQTLVVRGRIVRTYEAKPEAEQTRTQAGDEASPPENQPRAEPEKTPVNNHHATVEDDPEDDSLSIISATSSMSASRAGAATPAETSTPKTEVAKPAPAAVATPAQREPAQKVLMYERTIGEFSRTFHFPTRVDQDAVSATLENGVLTVVVPKARNVARRIVIN